jgi:hypothetical protein
VAPEPGSITTTRTPNGTAPVKHIRSGEKALLDSILLLQGHKVVGNILAKWLKGRDEKMGGKCCIHCNRKLLPAEAKSIMHERQKLPWHLFLI